MTPDEANRDLWLCDIAALESVMALQVWSARLAGDLIASPYLDQLREAYRARLNELNSSN
jgi:hypothetical protein